MNLRRVAVVGFASLAVVILSWVVLIGAVYAWSGVATVRVQDASEGVNLFVPVPMALVEVAVVGASWSHSEHFQTEIETHLEDLGDIAPMVRIILLELESCPDVTLVEVQDHGTYVKIMKRGGDLEIRVDDDESNVRVSIPIRSVRRTIDRLLT